MGEWLTSFVLFRGIDSKWDGDGEWEEESLGKREKERGGLMRRCEKKKY